MASVLLGPDELVVAVNPQKLMADVTAEFEALRSHLRLRKEWDMSVLVTHGRRCRRALVRLVRELQQAGKLVPFSSAPEPVPGATRLAVSPKLIAPGGALPAPTALALSQPVSRRRRFQRLDVGKALSLGLQDLASGARHVLGHLATARCSAR